MIGVRDVVTVTVHSKPKTHSKGFRRIKNLLLFCVAVSILIPPSVKVASISIFDLLIYFVLVSYFVERLFSRAQRQRIDTIEAILFGFLFLLLGAYLFNLDHEPVAFIESMGSSTTFLYERFTIYGVLTLVLLLGTYHITSRHMRSERDVSSTIGIILIAGTVNALVTLVVWIIQTGGEFGRYNFIPPLAESQGLHVYRMSLVFLLAFSIWTRGIGSRAKRIGMIITMVTSGASIGVVLVRQGWVMWVVGILFFLMFSWRRLSFRRRLGTIVIVAVFLVGAVYFLLQHQELVQNYFSAAIDPYSEDIQIRKVLVDNAIGVFLTHPVLGVGYGHFAAYSSVPVYITGQARYVTSAHNGIAMVAAETGILGLVFYVWLCISLLRLCIRAKRLAGSPLSKTVAMVVLSWLLVVITFESISNSAILPLPTERSMTQTMFLLWLLFGLSAAIGRTKELSSREMTEQQQHLTEIGKGPFVVGMPRPHPRKAN